MRFNYRVGEQIYSVDLEKSGEDYRAIVNGQMYAVKLIQAGQSGLSFALGNQPQLAYFAIDGTRHWIFTKHEPFVLDSAVTSEARGGDGRHAGHGAAGEKTIRAPMPGQVRAVQVKAGDEVEKGQTLLLLEAMKMEIRIQAPHAGQLKQLLVKTGQTVERDQALGEIEQVASQKVKRLES